MRFKNPFRPVRRRNPIQVTPRSHTDHGIPRDVMAWVLDQFKDAQGYTIQTVTLPDRLGTVKTGMHLDVPESEVYYKRRGNRPGKTRMTRRPAYDTNRVTIIAGPAKGYDGLVLYTMHGGEIAPREPFDRALKRDPAALAESKAFWARAALSEGA